MNRITTLLAVVIFMTMLSSCATMFSGTTQKVTITPNPPDADVLIDGANRGKTPIELSLKKELTGKPIEIKKEGYQNRILTPSTSFNTTAIVNIFVPIGFVIDAITGAMMKYSPTTYDVTLDKK